MVLYRTIYLTIYSPCTENFHSIHTSTHYAYMWDNPIYIDILFI